MKSREENYKYEDILFFYVAGALKGHENLEISRAMENNKTIEEQVSDYEQILISLAEDYGNKIPTSLKTKVIHNILLF